MGLIMPLGMSPRRHGVYLPLGDCPKIVIIMTQYLVEHWYLMCILVGVSLLSVKGWMRNNKTFFQCNLYLLMHFWKHEKRELMHFCWGITKNFVNVKKESWCILVLPNLLLVHDWCPYEPITCYVHRVVQIFA